MWKNCFFPEFSVQCSNITSRFSKKAAKRSDQIKMEQFNSKELLMSRMYLTWLLRVRHQNIWVRLFVCLIFLRFLPMAAGQVNEPMTPPIDDYETVFVHVTVSDSQNRFVTELEKEHFKITEGGVEQKILHFQHHQAPVSIGIILDTSGSMRRHGDINQRIDAIARFIGAGSPEDEYLLITFNQNPKLEKDFDQELSSFQNEAELQKQRGDTALYDAVYLGLNHVMKGNNDRKALILITDGEDNSSRYSRSEVLEYAKESDVQISGISNRRENDFGSPVTEKFIDVTGGRAFYPNSLNELNYYLDLIRTGMYFQYILGYKSTNQDRDGKWRRIKVELDPPDKRPKLKVQVREGYYAPLN